jgi:hypothetical protein
MPLKHLICSLYKLIGQTSLSDHDHRFETMRRSAQMHFLKTFRFFHVFFPFLDKRVKQRSISIRRFFASIAFVLPILTLIIPMHCPIKGGNSRRCIADFRRRLALRTLLQTIFRRYQVLDWGENITEGRILQFHNQSAALNFLQQFLRDARSMMTLRWLLTRFSFLGSISRLSDHEVLEQLAHQLVLVRLIIVEQPLLEMRAGTAESFEAPPAEPSAESLKLKAQAAFTKEKKAWIEIELLDEANRPVAYEPYRIVLPDQKTIREGRTNIKGMARESGIDPGTCTVSFPNLEKDAWASAQ